MIKMKNFRGDLTGISAETATLHTPVVQVSHPLQALAITYSVTRLEGLWLTSLDDYSTDRPLQLPGLATSAFFFRIE